MTVGKETIGDHHWSDLYIQAPFDPAILLRKSGVEYVCTELEKIEGLLLIREDIHNWTGGRNAFVTDTVYSSISRPKRMEIRVALPGMSGLAARLLTAHSYLPYHIQPGVVDILRNGYRLENGFELVML
jgi:hypothetical protein